MSWPMMCRGVFFGLSLCGGMVAHAQCPNPIWLPGEGVPGFSGYPGPGGSYVGGSVFCSINWDPDGAGPSTPRLVVAGDFPLIGDTPANSIAMWDGTTWVPLGDGILVDHFSGLGFDVGVLALAVLPNGNLVAAGGFRSAGGTSVNSIAQWNGTAWSALGDGLTDLAGSAGYVRALAVLSNGNLVAGGGFEVAGTTPANSIAQWNGTTWSTLGAGLRFDTEIGECAALTVRPNGHLVAAGYFNRAGNTNVNAIARWNGTGWAAYGAGLSLGGDMGGVQSLAVLPNGDVLVGGAFDTAGTVSVTNLARYNGSAWFDFGNGGTNPDAEVTSIVVEPSGNVLVGGIHLSSAGGTPITGGARWNGTAWTSLDLDVDQDYPGLLGIMTTGEIVGTNATRGSLYRGGTGAWASFNSGSYFSGRLLAVAPNGDVFQANDFSFAGSLQPRRIIRWDGTAWNPLAIEPDGFVNAMTCDAAGNLIIAEYVVQPTPPHTHRVRRWNGSTWTTLGDDFESWINAVVVSPAGDIFAAGQFTQVGPTPAKRLARWDGTAWSEYAGGVNGTLEVLAVAPGGSLVVGGSFTLAGASTPVSNIALWNGSAWSSLDSGVTGVGARVTKIAVNASGRVLAAGQFDFAGAFSIPVAHIAEWNGSAWSNAGNVIASGSNFHALLALNSGDFLVGGTFHQLFGDPVSNLALWDGTTWTGVGVLDGAVFALGQRPDGEVHVAGLFNTVNAQVSAHTARYICPTPACPADVDDGSGTGTPDGGVTIDDLIYYLSLFELGDIGADLDDGSGTGTPDGGVTIDDLIFYLTHFEAGC